MGGLHVTSVPDEAAMHCDAVVVGEGEPVWKELLDDADRGRLKSRYGPGAQFPLSAAAIPAFHLLDPDKYNRLTVQTSRGCPLQCEFCASSILLTSRYKQKPIDNVLAEIDRIRDIWRRPFIEFADDNSFVNRRYWKELLPELKNRHVRWFAECDLSIYQDAELLSLMRDSGCAQVLIGFESVERDVVSELESVRFKAGRVEGYARAVERIQSHGVSVNGCFILGADHHTPDAFRRVADFADEVGLAEVQVTVLTPFPGTPLYERLLKAGRIIEPGAWNKCTLFDVNFFPARMSPERLQWGLVELAAKLYHPDAVRSRRERFFEQLDRRRIRSAMPRPWELRRSA